MIYLYYCNAQKSTCKTTKIALLGKKLTSKVRKLSQIKRFFFRLKIRNYTKHIISILINKLNLVFSIASNIRKLSVTAV